ncbi:cofactor assembly of complex C isoform X2 [Wolffia australiana]
MSVVFSWTQLLSLRKTNSCNVTDMLPRTSNNPNSKVNVLTSISVLLRRRSIRVVARTATTSSSSSTVEGGYQGSKPRRNLVADWVSKNDEAARFLPIYVGGFALLAVLLNRALSGIAPVADASRAWTSLSEATCCRSLIIVHKKNCLLQIGISSESSSMDGVPIEVDVPTLLRGSLCQKALKSGKQTYLANLPLYPGRVEFPFLPTNTQALILQPIGDDGIAIAGGDTTRGFSSLDQAWITSISEKLEVTLSKLSNI